MAATWEALTARIKASGREVVHTGASRGDIVFSTGEMGRFTTPAVNLGENEPTDENIAEQLVDLPPTDQKYKVVKSPKRGSLRLTGEDMAFVCFPETPTPIAGTNKKGSGKGKGRGKPRTNGDLNTEPAGVNLDNGQTTV